MSTIVNPGTTPQVYTVEGHTIAAGDRLEDVSLDEVGQAAVDDGRLREVEEKKTATKKTTTKPTSERGPEDGSK